MQHKPSRTSSLPSADATHASPAAAALLALRACGRGFAHDDIGIGSYKSSTAHILQAFGDTSLPHFWSGVANRDVGVE
ncbi:hypothetical protein HYFRA_00006036 [Hymenoscyphus fraxineus]|uniref:Uncharacterized protein n=1 Tax=Hymenoscyphus fraxineus TaxID=746836 RepID=A0A9N9PIG7_9HELO|nr:hypothetical protein HYFRA_00006036 [Hymenoscyphus fraxineus]